MNFFTKNSSVAVVMMIVTIIVSSGCSSDEEGTGTPSKESTLAATSVATRGVDDAVAPTQTATSDTAITMEAPTASPVVVVLAPTKRATPQISTPTSQPASPIPVSPPTPTPTQLIPTATPPPSLVPTATVIPAVTPVPSPVPVPTPSVTPIPTATVVSLPPSPTPTATPWWTAVSATRTPTATAVPDGKYGVIVRLQSDLAGQTDLLNKLGSKWYIDYSIEPVAPSGKNRLMIVQDPAGANLGQLASIAAANPGLTWQVMGEPNKFTSAANVSTHIAGLLPSIRAVYLAIKNADPTARITSPAVLNWDWTCNGCGGFATGQAWMEEFISQYQANYGEAPPFDIWAMNMFPLDWGSLPTVRSDLVIGQFNAFSNYLLSDPAQADKPIWITEFGLHWGWDAYDTVECGGWWTPAGTYQTTAVKQYLKDVFNWVDANASSRNFEQVFLLGTYSDLQSCSAAQYSGLTLFNGPSASSGLTEIGRFYRNWIAGIKN
jgi:hypothetical protein